MLRKVEYFPYFDYGNKLVRRIKIANRIYRGLIQLRNLYKQTETINSITFGQREF